MGSLVIEWKPNFVCGMGYNTATGNLYETIAVQVSNDADEISSTVSPSSQSSLVESEESFVKAMNASASLSTGYCGIGLSASASMMMSMNMNRKTSAIVKYVHWREDHPTIVYSSRDTELTQGARETLEHKGPEEFYRKYGDCFIGGYYQGGEVYAGYRMEFSSVEERAAAKASVEASYYATSGSAQFEAKLNSNKVNCTTQLKWKAVGYPSGLLPETQDPTTGKEITGTWQMAVQFLDNINTKMGNKTQAVLARYENLDWYADALKNYRKNHRGSPSFIVPQSVSPDLGLVRDFNEMFSKLSLVRSQLSQTVTTGRIYENPGDLQRQDCLEQIQFFQDNIMLELAPRKLTEANDRLRQLQKDGENLWLAGQMALNNFDGTVIELWNVTPSSFISGRGDTRLGLDGFSKGAGLALYSAGPKAGTAPGPAPDLLLKDDLTSRFKVWLRENDFFLLQALGVQSDEPIFVGKGDRSTEPFKPWETTMAQFTARYAKSEIMKDGQVDLNKTFRWRGHLAGNGMIELRYGDFHHLESGTTGTDPLLVRVAPAAGDWKPAGDEHTAYWMVGLSWTKEPKAPDGVDWFRDACTQWQVRIVDDPVDIQRRR